MKIVSIIMISDSTAETVKSLVKATTAQFSKTVFDYRSYSLIKDQHRLKRIWQEILQHSQQNNYHTEIIFFSFANNDLRRKLSELTKDSDYRVIDILAAPISLLSQATKQLPDETIGKQHELNSDYYRRIDAMQFVLACDDGQAQHNLHKADVILLGISRTSKTPTCIYLANNGILAANIPIVPGVAVSEQIRNFARRGNPTLFGLYMDAEHMIKIRRHRQLGIADNGNRNYTSLTAVKDEIKMCRRLFDELAIPAINVTRRSVEETAAAIINRIEIVREQQPE